MLAPLVEAARVDLAIQTVAVLASCGHDLPLTIVGDGPERERPGAEGRTARRVRPGPFRGRPAARPGSRATWGRPTSCCSPLRETARRSPALEALITGVPVVACWDSGAAVDIVPESGAGRLTLPSAEALADSVLELQADGDRLAMSRLVGEAWRARLAPDNVAELCEGWYRDALAR